MCVYVDTEHSGSTTDPNALVQQRARSMGFRTACYVRKREISTPNKLATHCVDWTLNCRQRENGKPFPFSLTRKQPYRSQATFGGHLDSDLRQMCTPYSLQAGLQFHLHDLSLVDECVIPIISSRKSSLMWSINQWTLVWNSSVLSFSISCAWVMFFPAEERGTTSFSI